MLLNSLFGGDGEKAKDVDQLYSAWGEVAKDAQTDGWYPAEVGGDTTVYRQKYDNRFNIVDIPGQKEKGHIAAIAGKNGKFDLVIRDAKGNVHQPLKTGVSG